MFRKYSLKPACKMSSKRFQTFPRDPQLSFLSSDAFTVSTLVLMKANTSKTALSWKLCENVMDEWPRLLSITFSSRWVKTTELRADSCFYFDGVVFAVRVSRRFLNLVQSKRFHVITPCFLIDQPNFKPVLCHENKKYFKKTWTGDEQNEVE